MKILNGEAIRGDCLVEMKNIPDGSVDAIITDVPYGTTACKWDTIIPFEPMWEELKRIIKPNGAIVLFGSEPFSSALRISNIKMYKYDWIWEKNAGSNFATLKYQPMKEHENVIIFSKNTAKYNPQMQERSESGKKRVKTQIKYDRHQDNGVYGNTCQEVLFVNRPYLRYPRSIQKFNRERGLHPTQKPVALIEYLIKTYTNENETILDFTAGSFTTAIACENTNRKWICIEKDEGYFNIGINRINSI